MKQRILVMNGQKIVQSDQGGTWANQKVEKAGELKAGIYNLFNAKEADKSMKYEGMIVHSDNKNVYQQVGKNFVMHSSKDFDIVPTSGAAKSISYNKDGDAITTGAVKISRSRTR